MGRISRQVMFMEMAQVAAKRSTCSRLNVGALIVHRNTPISIGYGGTPSGHPHCQGNDCPGMVPGNCPTIHAEDNAIQRMDEMIAEPVDMYVTHSPCANCTRLIRESKIHISRLFFGVPYRETSHLETLRGYEYPLIQGRIWRKTEVYEVTPAGYIVEYFTREVVELP